MLRYCGKGVVMRNTMDVSYGTRVYRSSFYDYDDYEKKKDQKSTEGFFHKVTEKKDEKKTVSEELEVKVISPKEMTLEEYKQYIYRKISELPMHPSNRNDFIAVQISDAGFRVMKEDPEYEKWVLDTLQKDFLCYDPWSGSSGKYVIHSFGASKEAYHAESWRMDTQKERDRYNQKSKDSFWERRARRRKQLKKQYEKLLQKRLFEKKLYEKKVYERKLQARRYEASVAKSKIETKRQSQEWYQKKQLQATVLYEENSIVETSESMNIMG